MTSLISSPERAWHDAFADSAVIKNRFTRASNKTLPHELFQCYLGELIQVKRMIKTLPHQQFHIGMYAFAPDECIAKAVEKCVQGLAWSHLKAFNDVSNASFHDTTIALMLSHYATQECRAQLRRASAHRLSQSYLAKKLELPHRVYRKTWHSLFKRIVFQLVDEGKNAITSVSIKIDDINQRYQRV